MAPRKQSGRGTEGQGTSAKIKARKRQRQTDPTRDAPFRVDIANDGDFASIRHDFSEDEIKEQADQQKVK